MTAGRRRLAVSTPYPDVRSTAANPDETVVVVLTQGRIDRKHRAEFDRQTGHVADSMAAQPGLLGYSIRREVFGNTVWTLTMWKTDEARVKFLASTPHRRAIMKSGVAVLDMQSWRADVAVDQLPTSWAEALAAFADAPSN
jgi:quinol monooxygenase YgiN